MTELYINNVLCDLGDAVIVETKQANNFFEIKDRQTSFTNMFVIPPTPKNKAIYDMFGVAGNRSDFPYKVHRADLVRNGIQTVYDGKAIGTKFTHGKGLSISIQSGNISFYDSIGVKKVSELDFSPIDFIFDATTFANQINNTWQDGFIFPLADYGYLEDDIVNVNYQAPAIYYRWLWNKIWEESGYTYSYVGDNNVFDDDEFAKRVLAVDRGLSINTNPVVSTEIAALTYSGLPADNQTLVFNEILDTNNIHDVNDFLGALKSDITPNEKGFYTFVFTLNNGNANGAKIIIKKSGRRALTKTIQGTGNILSQSLYLTTNEIVTIEWEGVTENISFSVLVYFEKNAVSISFSNYWNKVSQRDFIKHVMQDYGLLLSKDEGTNNYRFITVRDLFYRINNSEDYSDKFDKVLTEDADISSFAKHNYLRYKYESEESFADGFFELNNETLKDEKTMFESIIYAIKQRSARYKSIGVFEMDYYEPSYDSDGNLEEIKGKDVKLYSFLVERSQISFDYRVNEQSQVFSYSGLYPIAKFDKLQYGYTVQRNYGVYKAVLDRFLKVVVDLKLSAIDMYNFDFFKLRYIKQLGAYFYVNKVQSFRPGKITKTELIKIDRSDVLGEYSNDFSDDFDI